mmetsp:Transcript_34689/g.78620  ORF Transcript_34689/g.78620 Transcript_34689/m.78620 type:complete len:249 (+) Transcript_34689:614-1360(+)
MPCCTVPTSLIVSAAAIVPPAAIVPTPVIVPPATIVPAASPGCPRARPPKTRVESPLRVADAGAAPGAISPPRSPPPSPPPLLPGCWLFWVRWRQSCARVSGRGEVANPPCSRSAAAGRRCGCLVRQRSTKASSSAVSGWESRGAGPLTIRNMADSGFERAACGASPSLSSMAVIPTDQMSARESCPSPLMTSGAIHCGVPITVCAIPNVDPVAAETPKSASLTAAEAVRRILAALTSRWMVCFCSCM